MKYKKSLIIPTIISTGLFTSTMVISADEMDNDENAPQEITEAEIVETEETGTQEDPAAQSEVDTETTQDETNADTQTGETEMAPEKETQPEVPADEETAESVETDENQPEETNDENSLDDTDLHNDKEENSNEETGNQENSSEAPEHQQIEEEDSIDDAESQEDTESDNVPEPDNQEDTTAPENNEETVEENNSNDAESQQDAESDNGPEPDNREDATAPENGEETEGEKAEAPETEDGAESDENDSSNEEMTDNDSEDEIPEEDSSDNEDDQTEEQSGDNDQESQDEEAPVLEEEAEVSVFSQLQEASSPLYSDSQRATRIKDSNNSGLYSPVTSDDSVSAERFMDKTLFIDRQAEYDGSTYYRILNGLDGPMQGWMKNEDLNLFHHSTPENHNSSYYLAPEDRQRNLLDEPWGTSDQTVKQLDQYDTNAVFNAEKSMKLGAINFYYGQIGNDYGWVQDNHLQDITTPLYSDARYATRINDNSNSGLYSPVTSNDSVSADGFMDKTLFVDRQADYDNNTYYRILNGLDGPMQGWMKSEDLNLFHLSTPDNHNNSYYVDQNNSERYLLDEPWGTSSQRNKQLNQYDSGDTFNAEQSMKLGAITFYYGSIGNDYGWVQSSHVTSNTPEPPANEPEVTTIQYDHSLEEVLDIQMNLSTPPQAWVDGGGWRNATRDEVRQFVDTSNHEGGAWDYTFLNLDESQGLSASVLDNNLLSNRGILTNEGNAFAQASETHGVNEVYLISHAILETGHGESQLAQGVTLDSNGNISNSGTTYYNMYGIGAVDNNALLGGARYAQQMGWDTPAKAIIGGANFVSQNYFNRGQNTLYSMRWNPENPGAYQYATDVNWAHATARNIQSYYNTLGVEGRYFTRYTF